MLVVSSTVWRRTARGDDDRFHPRVGDQLGRAGDHGQPGAGHPPGQALAVDAPNQPAPISPTPRGVLMPVLLS